MHFCSLTATCFILVAHAPPLSGPSGIDYFLPLNQNTFPYSYSPIDNLLSFLSTSPNQQTTNQLFTLTPWTGNDYLDIVPSPQSGGTNSIFQLSETRPKLIYSPNAWDPSTCQLCPAKNPSNCQSAEILTGGQVCPSPSKSIPSVDRYPCQSINRWYTKDCSSHGGNNKSCKLCPPPGDVGDLPCRPAIILFVEKPGSPDSIDWFVCPKTDKTVVCMDEGIWYPQWQGAWKWRISEGMNTLLGMARIVLDLPGPVYCCYQDIMMMSRKYDTIPS